MIITLTKVEQSFTKDGAESRKVTGVTGDGRETTKLVYDRLANKWPLLQENATLDFKMVKKGTFWNIADINPLEPPEAEPHDKILPEHQKVIEEARAEVSGKHPAPPGQQVGMWWKELGTRIGDGSDRKSVV